MWSDRLTPAEMANIAIRRARRIFLHSRCNAVVQYSPSTGLSVLRTDDLSRSYLDRFRWRIVGVYSDTVTEHNLAEDLAAHMRDFEDDDRMG